MGGAERDDTGERAGEKGTTTVRHGQGIHRRAVERGPLVLLVEDDDDIRSTVALTLVDEGFEVQEAESGDKALAWLRAVDRTPCIILVDLMMPGVSGWDLIELLRAEDRFVAIPVIVTSVLDESKAPAGIAGFMRKPIDLELMISLIKRHGADVC